MVITIINHPNLHSMKRSPPISSYGSFYGPLKITLKIKGPILHVSARHRDRESFTNNFYTANSSGPFPVNKDIIKFVAVNNTVHAYMQAILMSHTFASFENDFVGARLDLHKPGAEKSVHT